MLPLFLFPPVFTSGEAGMRRECALPVGQRTNVPVGARAESPPAWPLPRRYSEAEAAASHLKEQGICRQLPGQAGVSARGPGAAEDGAAERGGEARSRERRHEEGAGGAQRTPGCASEIRQGSGSGRRQPAGDGPSPQHRLGHHHRQESAAASATEGARAILEGDAETRLGFGIRGGDGEACNANTHTSAGLNTHAGRRAG